VLDGVPVAGPRAELAEGGEVRDSARVPRHEHWEALGEARLAPRLAFLERHRLLAVHSGGVGDDVVEDGEDAGKVVQSGVGDEGRRGVIDAGEGRSLWVLASRPKCLARPLQDTHSWKRSEGKRPSWTLGRKRWLRRGTPQPLV